VREVTFRTTRAEAGERLDRALMERLADLPRQVSRTLLQAWIAEGRARVNGAPARRAADRLAEGDEVAIVLPIPARRKREALPEDFPLAVLYEDDHLLAVDKPAGLLVHPTPGRPGGTLLNALLGRAPSWGPEASPGLVSRLDRGTSGVVLVAKRPAVHAALARALRGRRAEKEYLAVVYGRPEAPKGRIDLKIRRHPEGGRMEASPDEGADSSTLWERAAESPVAPLAALRCRLLTGRTHQIRVHLSAAGHPIVGDPLYGEPRWKGVAEPALADLCRDFPRQALHARRLAFTHPVTGAPVEVAAPVPEDIWGLMAAAGLGQPIS
jgi:23S rRNA pseudouridine1911/1915/1917 synthase